MHAHLGVLWEQVADATPDAPAVIQDARSISWRDCDRRAPESSNKLPEELVLVRRAPNGKVDSPSSKR